MFRKSLFGVYSNTGIFLHLAYGGILGSDPIKYMDDVISKDEFLDWYHNPKNYRPELPSTNRGHKFE